MGSGRDKKKKLKPTAPGAGREKTDRKTAAAEEKRVRRADKGAGEDDIDALLAKAKLEDAAATEVVLEEGCGRPEPRCNASLTPSPLPRSADLFLFGGERTDAGRTLVTNELFRFCRTKWVWTRIRSPGGPPPRSAHAAFAHRQHLYIFGGEFTSPNQEKFHHYKDLWRLDVTTWQWEQLALRGGPSARVLLFGGFYDAAKETRYFSDLWILDLDALKWTCVGSASTAADAAGGGVAGLDGGHWPPPPSGAGLALQTSPPGGGGGSSVAPPSEHVLFVYGGYRKDPPPAVAARTAASGAAKALPPPQDGGPVERGSALTDCWALPLPPGLLAPAHAAAGGASAPQPSSRASSSSAAAAAAAPPHPPPPGGVRWARVKREGVAPSARAGFVAAHIPPRAATSSSSSAASSSPAPAPDRLLLFGGVSDTEARNGEALVSEFHNDAYVLNLGQRRWWPLGMKPPPPPPPPPSAAVASDAPPSAAAAAAPIASVAPPPAAASASASASTSASTSAAPAAPPSSPALHAAAARIQAHFRGHCVRKVFRVFRVGGAVSELLYAPALGFPPPRAAAAAPYGRIGAASCVGASHGSGSAEVWLFGGMVELGDACEVAFDDLWRLDVGGKGGAAWACVVPPSVGREELRRMAEEAGGAAGGAGSSDGWEEGDEGEE